MSDTLPYTDELLARVTDAIAACRRDHGNHIQTDRLAATLIKHRVALVDPDRKMCWVDERVYEAQCHRAQTASRRELQQRQISDCNKGLLGMALGLLRQATVIADEAATEWDKAPDGMRAGKILLALAGHMPGYRSDTDTIHGVLNVATDEGPPPRRMTAADLGL